MKKNIITQEDAKYLTQASFNRLWARVILYSLYQKGVRHFCIAPGSRSTPLTLETVLLAETKKDIEIHTHFDERALAFLALGLAKVEKTAIAIIVTSGTAVANLLPAVVESGLTLEKMILLTADRPKELIQCGANQAIRQHDIFGQHVCDSINLPSPDGSISAKWLADEIDSRLDYQMRFGSSLHINCPYPEPLYGGLEDNQKMAMQSYLENVQYLFLDEKTKEQQANNLAGWLKDIPQKLLKDWQQYKKKKGLIIVGKIKQKDQQAIIELAEKLAWPILVDPQAGFSSNYAHFDLWLQNKPCLDLLSNCEFILQFGGRLVSKRLGQFLASFNHDYWLVDDGHERLDPYQKATQYQLSLSSLARSINKNLTSNPWATQLKQASQYCQKILTQHSENQQLSEINFAIDLTNYSLDNTAVFVGNSLAIRLLDMLTQLPPLSIFTNRGASGIDGNIATALGVQKAINKPMLCILGDTTALYDLNSFSLISQSTQAFVLVVINNNGGGIFDMLPVPDDKKEKFYRMPHNLNFEYAAKMFGLNYCVPKNLEQIKSCYQEAILNNQQLLIELILPAGEAGTDLNSLFNQVQNAQLI